MENNRTRILGIIKKNIVNKLKGRGSSLEDKKQLLDRELARNANLFLGSDSNKEIATEERKFILGILTELDWSLEVAEGHLERLEGIGEDNEPKKTRYVISEEKMKNFANAHEKIKEKITNEVEEIKKYDSESGKYDILYGRLLEIESAKGSTWGEEEIGFVVEKHKMGYSFKAIATILKRPERVVEKKYHEYK